MNRASINAMDVAHPADFSFKKLRELTAMDIEEARSIRIGQLPDKSKNNKFLTRTVWLTKNKLTSLENLDVFLESILEYPHELAWLDLSFNRITRLGSVLAKYPNLKIIYLHGNRIDSIDEVKKLQAVENLKSVSLHGNPIDDIYHYRFCMISTLPQITNLDFTPITKCERIQPGVRCSDKKT